MTLAMDKMDEYGLSNKVHLNPCQKDQSDMVEWDHIYLDHKDPEHLAALVSTQAYKTAV